MKKLVLLLTFFCAAAFAYDSCPCPDGDPGHVDHIKIQGIDQCAAKKAFSEKKSLRQAYTECSAKYQKERAV